MGRKPPMDSQHALLNEGEDDEMEVFGYKTGGFRRALCLAGYILSCGGLLLLFHWKPEWDVWANCQPCSLEEADVVLLRSTDERKRFTRKQVVSLDFQALLGTEKSGLSFSREMHSIVRRATKRLDMKGRYIQVQKMRYLWDFAEKHFARVGSSICGPNAIEIEIRPVWKLLFKEILNPFYVFQAFTLTLWYTQGYVEYSSAIVLLSVISIGLTIYDLRQQSIKLHNLVKEHNQVQVTVWTKGEGSSTVESRHLVPGDLLLLEGQRFSLPCDAILLEGSCVVNEGLLTGESVPVSKTPLPHSDNTLPWKAYGMGDYRRHVLFCGTEVIQTRRAGPGPVRAVVLQTGFNTAKGDLVRSILYPKPLNFRLYQQAFHFILGLAGVGILGMIYAICVYVTQKQPASDTVAMALLLLTVPVPPVIPAALTTSIVYAQRRLARKKIFCISPQRINLCGQINLVCFDKTGTLTEDGLDLWGALPCQSQSFQSVHSFSGAPLPWGPLCRAMATCHSLLLLDGEIQGDPLDLKMFEGTNWEMEEHRPDKSRASLPESCLLVKPGPGASPAPVEGILILHQFPFSSSLLRMSVITQELGKGGLELCMKGAPETVAGFCEEATVPNIFQAELRRFTAQGFRVIGLAHKELHLPQGAAFSDLEREDLESGLTFLGLLVMENRLKSETRPVLQELRQARIRSVMVTGDNLQTAITVAKSSGMLPSTSQVVLVDAQELEDSCPASVTWQLVEEEEAPFIPVSRDPHIPLEEPSAQEEGGHFHFVLSGASYQVLAKHFSSLLPKVLLNGTVFARMSPSQKSNLVEEFQKLDYYVGMCGDGANDCGALKMAHAGISLSEQEASVASPFTSQIPNIECVPALIREGRASLVASFAVFKYLTLYGLVQFIATVLLYWQLQILGNYQFLIQDIGITLVVCLTMNLTHAYPKLAPYRPPGRLLSPPLLLSVLFNVGLSLLLQLFAFLYVKRQAWYSQLRGHCGCPLGNQTTCPGNGTANATAQGHPVLSYEATTLWPLVTLSCIAFAFIFSKGRPFRKPLYTNYIFSGLLCLQLGVSLFLFFADLEGVYQRMELLCTPTIWRVYVLIMLLVFFLVSSLVEDGVLQNRRLWLRIKALCGFRSSSRYRALQRQLGSDAMWPPLHGRDLAGDDGRSSSRAYLNAAFEREEPAGRPGSRSGTARGGSAQPEGSSSRRDSPAEARRWPRRSEGTFPRGAAAP
ncbi:probable cation-transporting ATPase 13A5 [Notechis scutatus]|uniref:Cation-transporting ATPase n=1 Tax=Notechis scutatus TaxID=8663 RepID=A0A6J1VJ79_9SAUR|nr:probable cation-transporting ATPase 13A5 [Notechis scutatus]